MRASRLLIAIVVLASLCAGSVAASPVGASTDPGNTSILDSPGIRPLRDLARTHGTTAHLDEIVAHLLDQEDSREFVYGYSQVVGDLSGDGGRDVLGIRYESNDQGWTRVWVIAIDGDTGFRLWKRRFWGEHFALAALPARVGRTGAQGVVVLTAEGFTAQTSRIDYRAVGLNSRGKRIWDFEHRSDYAGYWPFYYDSPNELTSLGTFDALPGRATDLLVASGNVIRQGVSGTHSGVVFARTIDGRDGTVTDHPLPAVGVTIVPHGFVFGDLDGDRLDDYVFVTKRPEAGFGDEGADPVAVTTGSAEARTGEEGAAMWTTGGLDVQYQNIFSTDLGDVTGDERDDVFIETNQWLLDEYDHDHFRTYLIDGDSGELLWDRPGQWPFSPVRPNGRPRGVLTQAYFSDLGYAATYVWSWTVAGQRMWRRLYRSDYPAETCCSTMWHFGGTWGVGDLNGDATIDGHVHHWVGPFELREERVILIDGRRGRVLMRGDDSLRPLGVSLDGRGTDVVRVEWDLGDLQITAEDVASDRRLISSRLTFDRPVLPKNYTVSVDATRLDGDRCADVLVDLITADDATVAAIDGGSGRMMWRYVLGSGQDGPRVVENVDSNRRC